MMMVMLKMMVMLMLMATPFGPPVDKKMTFGEDDDHDKMIIDIKDTWLNGFGTTPDQEGC